MMKVSVLLIGVALLASSGGMGGQTKNASLHGVWQTVEVTIAGSSPRIITVPEPKPYLTIITARHYSRTEVQSEGPRPILADVAKATADELRAVWGPLVGEAGTYEVSGNVVTMHPLAAKNPTAMVPGAFITYTYRLERNTLWLTQQKNQNGAYPNPATFKALRLE